MKLTALVYILIAVAALSLPLAPWVSAFIYFLNSIVQPQYVYPWTFPEIPVFKITAALSIIGLGISIISGKANFSLYKSKQSLAILGILILMHISHQLTPFPDEWASVPPTVVLDTINVIVIMYFVALPMFNSNKSILFLCFGFMFSGVFYILWANSAYFGQDWYLFRNGRLEGPVDGPYRDGNILSVLLVMSMPFFIFFALYKDNKWVTIGVVVIIIFLWHALVLFSSRGAFLATAVCLLSISYLIKSKIFSAMIFVSFLIFVVVQGATLIERTSETVDSAAVEHEPIDPRILSWKVGLKIISLHPFIGVGVQKFEAASNAYFSGETSHVAHNTFLNFSVNSGLLSGFLFLLLVYWVIKRVWSVGRKEIHFRDPAYYALLSSSIAILGCFVCSIFLDLIIFEPLYLAFLINLVSWDRIKKN
ncbi:O-antigen ligase family protein [Marinobacter salinisoli]|uniref:O-antigen ligase family protein n=1 Tax=Marinobacter salinisoli TaxID=2769486 RepID=A0ABX7MMX1_9GAMM|nr:O-antigen ligase family protein [Marinobacter salinisoli]QSP93523.1 O-antigen ligase family protein [Marinobacter salinisoli]